MGAIASQITSLSIVYLMVYSGTDQRKHQSSALLAFVWGIHRWPVNSPHKWPVTRKCFHLMTSSWATILSRGDELTAVSLAQCRHDQAWSIADHYTTRNTIQCDLNKIQTFFLKISYLKMSPAKWQPLCSGFSVLNIEQHRFSMCQMKRTTLYCGNSNRQPSVECVSPTFGVRPELLPILKVKY